MKRKLLIATLLAATTGAYATNNPPPVAGGNASVTNSVSPVAVANPSQKQQQNTSNTVNSPSAATSSTANSNNPIQTVETHMPRQVAGAAAMSLLPTAVCSGTSAGGAQGASFGLSFGTSWTDENCMLLEQARSVAALGMPDVAAEMLCTIPNYADARAALGIPCVRQPVQKKQQVSNGSWDQTDPYIRHRLGLPPLK